MKYQGSRSATYTNNTFHYYWVGLEDCHNKISYFGGLHNINVLSPNLEARGLRSMWGQNWFLLRFLFLSWGWCLLSILLWSSLSTCQCSNHLFLKRYHWYQIEAQANGLISDLFKESVYKYSSILRYWGLVFYIWILHSVTIYTNNLYGNDGGKGLLVSRNF